MKLPNDNEGGYVRWYDQKPPGGKYGMTWKEATIALIIISVIALVMKLFV